MPGTMSNKVGNESLRNTNWVKWAKAINIEQEKERELIDAGRRNGIKEWNYKLAPNGDQNLWTKAKYDWQQGAWGRQLRLEERALEIWKNKWEAKLWDWKKEHTNL